jgi:hypothetical protein
MTSTVTPPAAPAPQPPHPAKPAWRPATVGAIVLLVAAGLFGGNAFGVRDRLLGAPTAPPRAAAASRNAGGNPDTTVSAAVPAAPEKTVIRSEPWWQQVTTQNGTGPGTAPVTIDTGAIQWRANWTCDGGHLTVQVPGARRPMIDAACPGNDVAYGSGKGPLTLQVQAAGSWRLSVEQQIDVPLNEPPLAAMNAPGASVTSSGDFYRIDQVGQGTVSIYRLAGGTWALRLENFYVTPNTDLEIELSPLAAPHSTDEFAASPAAHVASLDVTAGNMNFQVPPTINPRQYRSVVIWCDRLHSAYAAASLG